MSSIEQLKTRYANLSDQQLLALAEKPKDLLIEAIPVLRAELQTRNLNIDLNLLDTAIANYHINDGPGVRALPSLSLLIKALSHIAIGACNGMIVGVFFMHGTETWLFILLILDGLLAIAQFLYGLKLLWSFGSEHFDTAD